MSVALTGCSGQGHSFHGDGRPAGARAGGRKGERIVVPPRNRCSVTVGRSLAPHVGGVLTDERRDLLWGVVAQVECGVLQVVRQIEVEGEVDRLYPLGLGPPVIETVEPAELLRTDPPESDAGPTFVGERLTEVHLGFATTLNDRADVVVVPWGTLEGELVPIEERFRHDGHCLLESGLCSTREQTHVRFLHAV